jgi:hypothetical protein
MSLRCKVSCEGIWGQALKYQFSFEIYSRKKEGAVSGMHGEAQGRVNVRGAEVCKLDLIKRNKMEYIGIIE